MEKKEARIKCTGCGTSYKVKIPVTDRPVSFTCKKCGKVLKLRLKPSAKSAPPRPPASGASTKDQYQQPPEFETSQLPDVPDYQDTAAPPPIVRTSDEILGRVVTGKEGETPGSMRTGAGWLVLMGENVVGPFTPDVLQKMIQDGDISGETSIRMGERPWVQAGHVPEFRALFARPVKESRKRASGKRYAGEDWEKDRLVGGKRAFHENLSELLTYPLAAGNWPALGIFAGIAFALSAVLCLDFMIGLPINFAGWVLLYGYLALLMEQSAKSPEVSIPDWDFGNAPALLQAGSKVFMVLFLLSLLPVGLLLLLMLASFLNGMTGMGYIFMLLTPAVFIASLALAPAGLVTLYSSRNVGAAINPMKLVGLIKGGGQSYGRLVLVSVLVGLICMLITLLSVFLVEVPGAGFMIAALGMAAVLSFSHFVWFHAMGRFARERMKVTG